MTLLQSLAVELEEHITERIREISSGKVRNHFMLVIDLPNEAPIVVGTASEDVQMDLCEYILRAYHGPEDPK